ncbi:MAG: M1 family metallopeptidase [Clostridia bacterium]|nr:M1 family metallopeptidase [Clostridia bacterium]
MKKFLKVCCCAIICICSILFVGCKNKKDDLNALGQGLSTYYMDINYNNETKTLYAEQTLNYINNSDALLNEIYLHLYVANFCAGAKNTPIEDMYKAKAYPNGESFATLNIIRVKLNNVDIMPEYEGEDNDIMKINLNNKLEPTASTEIYIEYSLTLPNVSHRFGYTESGINLANFYPVACVYDENGWSKNPYHYNGDPFYSDMANYYVNFTCPANLTCAFSGNATKTVDGLTAYYSLENVCVREFAVMLSDNFKVLSKKDGDITYTYYYLQDNTPDKALQCAIDSINTFSEIYYPYPYKTYNVVQSSFLYGGMEYPMLSLISNSIENYDDYLNVIVHETAHQWWYSLVGNDQYTNPWLDEALTEFSTLMFYDNNKGYNLNRKDMLNAMQENYNLFVSVYSDVLGSIDTSLTRDISQYPTSPEYTYCVYVKGTLMFDSLYQLLGKKQFLKAVQLYAKTHAYNIATPADLISCFEKTSKSNLENFFDCWLNDKVIIN